MVRASCSNRCKRSASFDNCFGKDLDRDVPTETRVFGAVNFTHSASVDGSDDFDDERVDELAPGCCKTDLLLRLILVACLWAIRRCFIDHSNF
jgi:hypothetical protein